MKRSTQIAIIGFFALVVFVPLLGFVIGFRSGEIENRELTGVPEVSAPNLVDEEFYSDLTQAYTDRVPFRDDAVAADAWIDVEVFGDSPNPTVGIGADDWLFHADTWKPMCGEVDVDQATETMRGLTNVLTAAGKPAAFVIAPDKGGVYPDQLGQLEASFDCADQRRAQLRAALAADPPIGWIDAWALTADLRATTDELIYYPHDTHWTTYTAVEIAERIVNELEEGAWDEGGVKYKGTHAYNGDLANLMGLPRTQEINRYDVNRNNVKLDRVQSGQRKITKYVAETKQNATILPGRALVIHDSFGNPLQRPLANHFEETWFVHWRLLKQGIVDFEELAAIAAESNYVVIEVVERLSYERFLVDFPEIDDLMAEGMAAVAVGS
jgi:hypothetical protein